FQRSFGINANEAITARVPCRRTLEAGFSQRNRRHRACGKTFSGLRQIGQREISAHRALLFSVAAKKLGSSLNESCGAEARTTPWAPDDPTVSGAADGRASSESARGRCRP